ncbi:type 1 fimbrial protein subunit FimI [Enterobacteriaceae bacterium ML5]|nr:type 1 fimbrial protein subunit FimI [Enterobacteriaceae bacterium ML5]
MPEGVMFLRFRVLCLVLFFLTGFSGSVFARNHVVTIRGGDLHLKGVLAEGACAVSTESEDMHVDMGQYRNNDFDGTGSDAPLQIPFTIHLTDCNPAIAKRVGVSFYGVTDPAAPRAFLVTDGEGGGLATTGLSLIITDSKGEPVIPDAVPDAAYRVRGSEVTLPFAAHYRATSPEVHPGALESEVWFRIVYP